MNELSKDQLINEIEKLTRTITDKNNTINTLTIRVTQEKARNEALFEVIEKLITEVKG